MMPDSVMPDAVMAAPADTLEHDMARKDALLEAILPEVVFDGWSRQALLRAARKIDMGGAEIADLLPGGVTELARSLDWWADRRMAAALERIDVAAMKVRDRVTLGIRTRLELLTPYREAVRRAIALNCSPLGTSHSLRAVCRTIDTIWVMAGDISTDFNFYTKRGLLAAVYTSTVLFWLDDRSEGQERSWAFLDRRIGDVMKIPSVTARVKDGVRRAFLPWAAFRRRAE